MENRTGASWYERLPLVLYLLSALGALLAVAIEVRQFYRGWCR
jgi:hypothetical protein